MKAQEDIPWTAEDEKAKARHRCGFEGEPGAPFDEPLGGKEDV
jgi:hypothetical protein